VKALVFATVAASACSGRVGTIDLSLTTAPGSTVLDAVQRLRITITNPLVVVESPRTANGFDIVLDVEAVGGAGQLIVEGFDAGDALIATGMSPPFAISAIDASVVIYVAAPLTIAPAPLKLPVARVGVSSTSLSYGFAIAGGEDEATMPSDSIFIYNAFDHSLLSGMPMPAVRAFQTMATSSNDGVLLFGGVDATGAATGTLWRFDSNARPNGGYQILEERPDLARSGTPAINIASELHVITGTPPIELTFDTAVALTDPASLGGNAAVAVIDGASIAVFGGDPVVRLRDGAYDSLALSVDLDDSAVAIGGRIAFVGGGADTELAVVDADTGAATFVEVLSTVRHGAATAATDRFVVIAGGTDAADVTIATADILSAIDLSFVATIPCLARAGATALVLPNGQIAIVGGEPANDLLELFTPPPPTL
jgi:hypothetical protein